MCQCARVRSGPFRYFCFQQTKFIIADAVVGKCRVCYLKISASCLCSGYRCDWEMVEFITTKFFFFAKFIVLYFFFNKKKSLILPQYKFMCLKKFSLWVRYSGKKNIVHWPVHASKMTIKVNRSLSFPQ
jgi:hypothetical protein